MQPCDGDRPYGFQRVGHDAAGIGRLPRARLAGPREAGEVRSGGEAAATTADDDDAHLRVCIEGPGGGGQFLQGLKRERVQLVRAVEPEACDGACVFDYQCFVHPVVSGVG